MLKVLPLLTLVLLAACGGSAATGKPSMPATSTWAATNSTYRLTLSISPAEAMYTPAQVAAQHPTTGEVMLRGSMVMPSGGNMEGWRHLEVHFYDAGTGAVLRDLQPVITVTDAASGKRVTLPVAAMQGVREGASDFHYGNNVYLPSHAYSVVVAAGGETTRFKVDL